VRFLVCGLRGISIEYLATQALLGEMANLQNVNFLKSQLAKSQPEHKMTKMLWLTFSKLTIFHRNNQVF
jgi:hypothetical protein